ncbi:MAG TPA: hypothetical protein VFS39_15365, partial [Nitrospira sp.]|nr:hypothetical protein [Nitrospira sp.]
MRQGPGSILQAAPPAAAVPSDESQSRSLFESITVGALMAAAVALSFAASSGPIQWMDNGWLLYVASQGRYFAEHLYATTHPFYHFVTVALFNLFGFNSVAYLNSALLIPIAFISYRLGKAVGLD